ncbi:hypothetical protein QR680_019382 [Steinernema hermaphroditum]|uniref:Dynein heavy chain AAA module D4 domain-containing protein n=1 Tax=Steinernema hermaphroditum TaxID=289476 RepID=A0AA39GP80_9BILA|nr:hypothetical protein QR680_019382 [Steinernema hermaphroditum]
MDTVPYDFVASVMRLIFSTDLYMQAKHIRALGGNYGRIAGRIALKYVHCEIYVPGLFSDEPLDDGSDRKFSCSPVFRSSFFCRKVSPDSIAGVRDIRRFSVTFSKRYWLDEVPDIRDGITHRQFLKLMQIYRHTRFRELAIWDFPLRDAFQFGAIPNGMSFFNCVTLCYQENMSSFKEVLMRFLDARKLEVLNLICRGLENYYDTYDTRPKPLPESPPPEWLREILLKTFLQPQMTYLYLCFNPSWMSTTFFDAVVTRWIQSPETFPETIFRRITFKGAPSPILLQKFGFRTICTPPVPNDDLFWWLSGRERIFDLPHPTEQKRRLVLHVYIKSDMFSQRRNISGKKFFALASDCMLEFWFNHGEAASFCREETLNLYNIPWSGSSDCIKEIPGNRCSTEALHMKRHHEGLYEQLQERKTEPNNKKRKLDPQTPSISSAFGAWQPGGTRYESASRALALMLAVDSQPFAMVDRPGFQNFCKVLAPSFKIRSRTSMMRMDIPTLYADYKKRVQGRVEKASYISFTTDSWSSEDNRHSLLSLTGHWVHGGRQEFRVLGVIPIRGRHNSENLSSLLLSCLADFIGKDDKNKCHLVVRDAASTMKKTTRMCGLASIDCFAHKLQLAVYGGLGSVIDDEDQFTTLIENTKKFVRKLRKSPVDRDHFKDLQSLEKLSPRWLVKGIEVRWSSLHDMLERFVENRSVVKAFLIDRSDYPKFNSGDFSMMMKILHALKPIKEATTMLQGRSVTISAVIPTIFVLRPTDDNSSQMSFFEKYRSVQISEDPISSPPLDDKLRLRLEVDKYLGESAQPLADPIQYWANTIPKPLLKSKGMDVSDDVVASFGEIFESAPSDSQTPTRFSGFIENYLKIFGEKRESVGTRLNRLRAGVSKLTETRDGEVSCVSLLRREVPQRVGELVELLRGKETRNVAGGKNDLKAAMQTAAVENENVVFVIEDYQVLSESFLEMLNSVLSSGDVPGLFSPQEFDQFGNALRDLASQQGYTRDLYSFFSYKVHQNLHVAIIANVDSDCFVKNLTANPAFYKQANVLWNESWSKRTLVQIPKLLLKSKGMDVSDDIVVSFGEIFESAPPDSQTPTRFSVFIENYLKIFGEKRESVGTRLNRRAGVSKLTETRDGKKSKK